MINNAESKLPLEICSTKRCAQLGRRRKKKPRTHKHKHNIRTYRRLTYCEHGQIFINHYFCFLLCLISFFMVNLFNFNRIFCFKPNTHVSIDTFHTFDCDRRWKFKNLKVNKNKTVPRHLTIGAKIRVGFKLWDCLQITAQNQINQLKRAHVNWSRLFAFSESSV